MENCTKHYVSELFAIRKSFDGMCVFVTDDLNYKANHILNSLANTRSIRKDVSNTAIGLAYTRMHIYIYYVFPYSLI